MDQKSELDKLYEELTPKLIWYAQTHLLRRDDALDVVHQAFEKFLVYRDKHKDKETSEFILRREILRICRRLNKTAIVEIPLDFNRDSRYNDSYE